MTFKQFFSFTLFSIIILLTGCNFNQGESPPAAPIPAVEAVEEVTQAPQVTALQDTPIWAGPSEAYEQIGGLGIGQTAAIIGRSEQGTYWVISFAASTNGQGWIASNMVTVQGDTSNAPLVMAPTLPEAVAEAPVTEPEAESVKTEDETDVAPEIEMEDEPAAESEETEDETEIVPEDDDDTPSPAEGDDEDAAPQEPEVDPTQVPPAVIDDKAEVDPTPAPPVEDLDKAPQPTATPDITVNDGLTIAPTPTPELGIVTIVPVFYDQVSYGGDCSNRPENTICVGFPDGYIWLIEDTVLNWSDGEYEGQAVKIAEGVHGYYHHILNTSSVKFVPKG